MGRKEKARQWLMGVHLPATMGQNSYNQRASHYCITTFIKSSKAHRPLDPSHNRPLLSDEEAWDLAACVSSMPRPEKDLSGDLPGIGKKPFEHPFGLVAGSFSEQQPAYRPFNPIVAESQKQ